MNRIFPLQLIPQRGRGYLYALLAFVLVASLWNVLAAMHAVSGISDVIRKLFAAAVLLGAVTGAMQMKSLARAGQFLGSQQVPDALWRAWVRAAVLELSLIWVALCAAMSALLASRASTLPWPEGAALISLSLSLGAIAVHQRGSMAARGLGWLANDFGAAVILVLFGFGAATILDIVATWPPPLLWLLALSWPALALSLVLNRSLTLDAFRADRDAGGGPKPSSWKSELRRLSPLDAASWKWSIGAAAPKPETGPRLAWLTYLGLPLYVYMGDFTPLVWNEAADVRHLMSIAGFGITMTMPLLVRDLHWRAMLLPGGWQHGRIASDIFSTTLKAQYAILTIAAIFSLGMDHLVRGIAFEQALQTVTNHVLMMATVPFAISVALVLRALPRPNSVRIAIFLILCACWLYIRFVVGYSKLPRWNTDGLTCAAILLGMSWLTLRLANRMWTAEKLIACARGSK